MLLFSAQNTGSSWGKLRHETSPTHILGKRAAPRAFAAPRAAWPESFCFQWQPLQEEQLPEQPASGCCTLMGSPPFIAVLMMASM